MTLFDTETDERIGEHQAPGRPTGSPSIRRATRSRSLEGLRRTDGGTWRSSTRHGAGAQLARPLSPPAKGSRYFAIVIYAPDGRSVFVRYARRLDAATPVFLRRFDARSGSPLGTAVRVGPSRSAGRLMTADGRLLVYRRPGGRRTRSTRRRLRVIRRYPVGADADAVSPDGRTLAIERHGRGPSPARPRLRKGADADRRRGRVELEAFSPDGRTLSTAEDDGNVILWDVEQGVADRDPRGPHGHHRSACLQPRRAHPVYGRQRRPRDRLGRGRGPPARAPVPDRIGHEPGRALPPAFALSPDGRTLAVARLDGRVELIDAETLRRTGGFEAFPGRSALAIDYSADGRRLAVAGEGGGVGVWDAESGERVGALLRAPRGPRTVNPRTVRALAFGQGDLLAAAEVGGAVRIWDVGRRELLRPPLRLPPSVLRAGVQPGRLAAGDSVRRRLRRRSQRSRDSRRRKRRAGCEAFPRRRGPLGCLLPRRQPARGWHGRRRRAPLGDRRLGAGGSVRSLASTASTLEVEFSPDGHTLATSHSDRLGGALGRRLAGADRAPPARPSPTRATMPATARFTPTAPTCSCYPTPGRAIRWEVDPELWLQRACAVAGGGLTPEQWEEVVPEQDYVSVCPSG